MAAPGAAAEGDVMPAKSCKPRAEALHEAAVYLVFPAPDPSSRKADGASRGHCKFIAGADQCQPAALRAVGAQGQALHGALQVVGQRHAHAHGKHARFFQRKVLHGRHITGGKDAWIGDALQGVVHADAMVFGECQTRALQPCTATGLGDPQHLVSVKPRALRAA